MSRLETANVKVKNTGMKIISTSVVTAGNKPVFSNVAVFSAWPVSFSQATSDSKLFPRIYVGKLSEWSGKRRIGISTFRGASFRSRNALAATAHLHIVCALLQMLQCIALRFSLSYPMNIGISGIMMERIRLS